MARTAIPVVDLPAYGVSVDDFSTTTGDDVNNMQISHPGGSLVLYIENTTGTARPVVLKGVASQYTFNRATDVTYSCVAYSQNIVVIPDRGFDQGDGVVHLDIASYGTSLQFAAFRVILTPIL